MRSAALDGKCGGRIGVGRSNKKREFCYLVQSSFFYLFTNLLRLNTCLKFQNFVLKMNFRSKVRTKCGEKLIQAFKH